jgi:hypothetical protein
MSTLNNEAIAVLVDLVAKDPILFVGAGLVIPPYWRWSELLSEIGQKMNIIVPPCDDHLATAQELYNVDPPAFNKAIASLFQASPSIFRPALSHIATIGFRSIITTNFDRTIEMAYMCADKTPPRPFVYPNLMPLFCDGGTIHYIHGRVSENGTVDENIVLHRGSYQRSYYDDPHIIPNFLFQVFLKNDIIFTGYSLSPYEPITHILPTVRNFLLDPQYSEIAKDFPTKRRHILLPADECNEESKRRLDKLGITVIPFDKIDADYTGLDNIWHTVCIKSKQKRPLTSLPQFNPFSSMGNSIGK